MTGNRQEKPIRAAIYARVSTGHQDVEMQISELRQVAGQRGWKIVDTYIDEGISGSVESRPALDKLMADARAGRIDLVVCWKLDRLGRSLQHLLALLDELSVINVGFVSVRDSGIDTTTATGKLMLKLIGAFAEYERSMIRERVKAGVDRAKAKGIALGRPRREFDVRAALALMEQGHGLKSMSRILNIPRSTIRQRLVEAGKWPRKTGSENPFT